MRQCEGCGEQVKPEHLSQEDTENAPWLCLVCAYPDFYRYVDSEQAKLPD